MLCPVCQQPECGDSRGVSRSCDPGASASRLEPGQHEWRGYTDWAVHPVEAIFLLHRGYAIVDGQRARVAFIHNEAYVTQLSVDGSYLVHELEQKLNDASADRQPVEAH